MWPASRARTVSFIMAGDRAECSAAARIPASLARWTWSTMSDTRGLTTTVEPSQDERGHLITDALATTRRKDSQRVGARDRRLDKLLLPRAKGWVPEVLAKHILGMERPWHDSTVRASRGQEHGHRCRGGADVARR